MSKTPPGHGTTRVTTQPYQVLSVDFAFLGMTSGYSDQKSIHEGINGKTVWILITDNFTGMNNVDASISKVSSITCLRNLLKHYSPTCNDKYIHLDQRGELFNNPYVNNLLKWFCYTLNPTGSDTSNQNGPVKWSHIKLAKSLWGMLNGANLDIKFWKYVLCHAIQLYNSFP